MAIKELFYDNRPQVLLDPRASQRIDPRFKFTRNSTAYHLTDSNNYIALSSNVPRFSQAGLLLEPQSQNIVINSLTSTAIGINSNVSPAITNNTTIAPDGTQTAFQFPIGSSGFQQGNYTITAGRVYTASFFVKKGPSNDVNVGFIGMNSGELVFGKIYDFSTKVASQNWKAQDFPNGWVRLSRTYATSTSLFIFRFNSSAATPGSGTDGLYMWGFQLEEQPIATSFIKTTGSSVTRAADLLSVEAPLPSSGSIYIDARPLVTNLNGTLLSLKNSSNNKIDLGFFSNAATYNSLALIASYNGTSKTSLPLPVPTLNRERNIVTYGSQNYQYGTSNSRFATSLSSSVPTNLNKLSIGHDSVDPTKAFNGYINSLYAWSGELTPTVAEALVRSNLDPINADTFVPSGPAGSLSIVINTQGASASGDKVFALPAESDANNNDLVITWGDGTESGIENAAAELGASGLQKTYVAAGIYSIFVQGRLENLQFNNSASASDVVQIVQWGTTANGNDVFLSPSTMVNAFYGCSKMDFSSAAKTTNLPNTSAVQNWSQAFYNCSSITGTFPQFSFSGATNFTRAWRGCSSLTAFTAAGGQPQNVTNFTEAWYGCLGLTSFPLINTSSGTNFSGAWYGCTGLTSFPLINTAAGTNFASAWLDCTSLTSFPLINTAAGTNFSSAWRNCSSLTSFPIINTSSGTNFTAAWLDCTSLTSFPLIDTAAGTIFTSAWQNCFNLTIFPLIDTGAGTNFSSAWYNNYGLTIFPALDFDAAVGLASDASSTFTGFRDAWRNCSSLADFPANRFNTTTCTRYLDAFTGCALTAASIENILVSINAANTSNGNLSLQSGTNAGASTWTANAITAYNALVARGWTITRNA